MRKIEPYLLKEEHTFGDPSNLLSLQKKVAEDKKVVLEIETDYKKNPEEYKTEYIDAKRNHLKNCVIGNYLILKYYEEKSIMADLFHRDSQKSMLEEDGWMLPSQLIGVELMFTGDFPIEEGYMNYFDNNFERFFGFNIGEPNSRVDRYYKQAIRCYQEGLYYSCVVSLFPIIESIHQVTTRFNEDKFYRIKNNLDKVPDLMSKIIKVFNVENKYIKHIIEQFNDLAKNHYFSNSVKRLEEPKIINRNRVMHGVFSREISRKDCLQLFCTISCMNLIKNLLDANDAIESISEELEKLSSN